MGKWRCEEIEHLVDGKKEEDMCVARLADVGLAPADIRVLNEMGKFAAELAGTAMGRTMATDWEFEALAKAVGYEAMPLRWRDATDGRTSVVKSIERTSIPPASFELPRGYKKQDVDFGGKP